MPNLFRKSLYDELRPLTPGFPSLRSLYVQFFKPCYVMKKITQPNSQIYQYYNIL